MSVGFVAIFGLPFREEKKDRVIERQRVAHQAELERQEKKIVDKVGKGAA